MRKRFIITISIFVIMIAGGCGVPERYRCYRYRAYSGPELPLTETAVLLTRHGRHHTRVLSIDGQAENTYDSYNSAVPYCSSIKFAKEIHLPPGMHSLTVEYFHRQSHDVNLYWRETATEQSQPRTIWHQFEKGCVYELVEFVGGFPSRFDRDPVKIQMPDRLWIPSVRQVEDINGTNGLLSAAANADLARIRSILEAGTDINARNLDGLTALHTAVLNNQRDAVKFLIRSGADVNAAAGDNITALHIAAAAGDTETARLLIRSGADINAAVSNGKTALGYAKWTGRGEMVKMLITYGARE